jgi:hypothetical protein
VGHPADRRNDAWVDAFQFRNHPLPHADPGKLDLEIRWIVVCPDIFFVAIRTCLTSPKRKKRPHDPVPAGWDSTQAGHSGSSCEVENDGFGQIIECVSRRDEVESGLSQDLLKKTIASGSTRFFEPDFHAGGQTWHIGAACGKGNSQALTKRLAPFKLLVGLLALAMMQVSRHDLKSCSYEQMEEARRIRAAAVADHDSIPGIQEP